MYEKINSKTRDNNSLVSSYTTYSNIGILEKCSLLELKTLKNRKSILSSIIEYSYKIRIHILKILV